MLGGLIFIEKIEGLVGLLTGTGGPSVEGAIKDFGNFSNTMMTGAAAAFGGASGAIAAGKAAYGASWGGHHLAGAIAGGAGGFIAPVLGTGTTSRMAANAGIKLAHQMGNYFSNSGQVKNSSPSAYSSKDSSSDSDLANSLQNLSNNLQTKNMNRKPPPNKGKGEGLG
jgi:hypothetical protein